MSDYDYDEEERRNEEAHEAALQEEWDHMAELAASEDAAAQGQRDNYRRRADKGTLTRSMLEHEHQMRDRMHKGMPLRMCIVCGWHDPDSEPDTMMLPDGDIQWAHREWDALKDVCVPEAVVAEKQSMKLPKPKRTRAKKWESVHAAATAQDNEYWQEMRRRVFKRDAHTCQGCLDPEAQPLVCHHLVYRNMGLELAHQLISLCNDCHDKVHFKGKYKHKEPPCYTERTLPNWRF